MLLKITPVINNRSNETQSGKSEAQEIDSMCVALKQCAHYIKGTDVFKFFVISKIDE